MTTYPIPTLSEKNNELHLENVSLNHLVKEYGTPLYVYSKAALQQAWDAWQHPNADRNIHICYAVKANSNLAILQFFAQRGAYFDTVSKGEIARVIKAGASADRIVFSGVGKTVEEITYALEQGIHCFNVESLPELDRIHDIATHLGKRAPISLRINPDVDAQTHPYISTGLKENKFGIDHNLAESAYMHAASLSGLKIAGIDYHIGSQLTNLSPYLDAQNRLFNLVKKLAARGIELEHIDLGGGLGVRYKDETPPAASELIAQSLQGLRDVGFKHTLMFEPGRSLVANAGLLLTNVEYLKPTEAKNFAIVDAGMNDLIRPALYQSWMQVVNTTVRNEPAINYDIVGPVCESSDWFAHDRELAIAAGDTLAILSAGAYSMTMASNYNTRQRPAEVLVDNQETHLIRQRDTLNSLWGNEQLL
ncbi:diaminopimelate decarboxylase [Formosimonas limnophila]|uniref:Diaminopimelate decarboxylase n=1 Tax=Formosimonas limnophila TaxID=1384487 RepID=A0A8J3G0X1_9BURK|nr:diaminopimelate decarboxylase [Formosimonas limnophila]GHA77523.1 diaminopimelate decarboxylase [Formosimonas limnophila]